MSAVAGAPCAPTRRYSILVTAGEREPGTWHTITAASLGDALRGIRSGSLWDAAHVSLPREKATVSAIECLGFTGIARP